MELSRAFEHAEELFEFSSDIQALISTHSPAFYSLLSKGEGVKAYSVVPEAEGTVLREVGKDGLPEFDETLGLMTLVTPYVKQKADELKVLTKRADDLANQLKNKHRLVILVAGETDASYLRSAFEALNAELAKKVVISHMGTSGHGGASGGGDSNLLRFAKDLAHKDELHACQILVLLDCDVTTTLPEPNSESLSFRKLPFHTSRLKFKKGIENMFSDALALPQFYRNSTKSDDYGGATTSVRLDKVRLCSAICDKKSDLPIRWNDRFENFQCVVEWAEGCLGQGA